MIDSNYKFKRNQEIFLEDLAMGIPRTKVNYVRKYGFERPWHIDVKLPSGQVICTDRRFCSLE